MPGRIRVVSWDLDHATFQEVHPLVLRKHLDGTWYWWAPPPWYPPTRKAVYHPYNPRASSIDAGTSSPPAGNWKIKIKGQCWGTLCQYAGQYYPTAGAEDKDGPEDSDMLGIRPASATLVRLAQSEWMEFTPTSAALIPIVGHPEGGPALAIFWPGMQPSDFSWYPL